MRIMKMRMTRTTRMQDEDGDGDKGGDQDVDNEGHRTTRMDECVCCFPSGYEKLFSHTPSYHSFGSYFR